MIPIVFFPSILEDDELSNLLLYPLYVPNLGATLTSTIQTLQRSLKLEDADTVKTLTFDGVTITNAGGAKSLHNISGLANYQVTSGKTAKLILIMQGGAANVQFKVWESTSADTASGITKYTYAGNEFDSGSLITVSPDWDITPLTFAASKFVTIEVTSGSGIVGVIAAIVVET